MVAPFQQAKRVTIEEYFRLEEASEEKHEFREGFILPLGETLVMPDRHYEHSLLAASVIGELRSRLKSGPYRTLAGNLRIRMGRSVFYSYPDASVICRGTEATARIRSLAVDLPLSEAYAGVEFAATGAEPSASPAV